MNPPVFEVLRTPDVLSIVGQDNPKIYGFGEAPQGTPAPYISWFLIADAPQEHLSGAPSVDFDAVQIDCYAGPEDEAERVIGLLAYAVRAALDIKGISNRVIISHRESDTRLFRISIEADFITYR